MARMLRESSTGLHQSFAACCAVATFASRPYGASTPFQSNLAEASRPSLAGTNAGSFGELRTIEVVAARAVTRRCVEASNPSNRPGPGLPNPMALTIVAHVHEVR